MLHWEKSLWLLNLLIKDDSRKLSPVVAGFHEEKTNASANQTSMGVN